MFNFKQYVFDLTVDQDNQERVDAEQALEVNQVLYGDPWLVRAHTFGVAGAMQRQVEFVMGTLLPQQEQKLARLKSDGVLGESYVNAAWNTTDTTNATDPHINDENPTQEIDDCEMFIEQLRSRVLTACIHFIVNLIVHDDVSKDLNQKTYGQIQATSAANRKARMVA